MSERHARPAACENVCAREPARRNRARATCSNVWPHAAMRCTRGGHGCACACEGACARARLRACVRLRVCISAAARLRMHSGARSDAPDHPSRRGLRSPPRTNAVRRGALRGGRSRRVPRNGTARPRLIERRARNACARVCVRACLCVCVCLCVRGCARGLTRAAGGGVEEREWAVVPLLQRTAVDAASLPRRCRGPPSAPTE